MRSVVIKVVVLLALAGGVAATAAAGPATSMLSLPSGVDFYGVQAVGDRLLLSGGEISGPNCGWLVVDQDLGVESPLPSGSCERPPDAGEPVVPVQFPIADSNESSARIARPNPSPSRVTYGPVVMTFNDVSDTHLEWVYGPGRLWLYDVAALRGATGPSRAEALAVSTTTGRVVQTVSMPRLDRPLLAADSDGLWIAASPESGAGPSAATYFLSADAHAPRLVHRGGYAAFWIVASGHAVWEDIASTTPSSSVVRQEIWRYDGSSASPHPLASADNLDVLTPAVQPRSTALWTIGSPQFGHGRAFTCVDEQVVKIDELTGRQTIAATIHVLGNPCDPEPGNGSLPYGANSQTFAGGAFYFLADGLAGEPLLYRVQA